MRNFASLVICLGFLTGCLSSTTLRSSDPDAHVVVGGKTSEENVLHWSDRQALWGNLNARVEKPGCEPRRYTISKRDEFSPEGFLTGFITYGIGFLWSTKYLPDYVLHYECVASAKTESAK